MDFIFQGKAWMADESHIHVTAIGMTMVGITGIDAVWRERSVCLIQDAK